jgi:hypothetical protein
MTKEAIKIRCVRCVTAFEVRGSIAFCVACQLRFFVNDQGMVTSMPDRDTRRTTYARLASELAGPGPLEDQQDGDVIAFVHVRPGVVTEEVIRRDMDELYADFQESFVSCPEIEIVDDDLTPLLIPKEEEWEGRVIRSIGFTGLSQHVGVLCEIACPGSGLMLYFVD